MAHATLRRVISRRGFLRLAGGAGLSLAGAQLLRSPLLTSPAGAAQLPADPFRLGIASGDPRPDRVILWTRLAPDPLAPDGGMAPEPFTLRWEVAHDERFARIAAKGRTIADPAHAHSVHVDAKGLEPGRDYYYRFLAAGEESPIGRTRTAPATGSSPRRVRLGFGSCQDYEDGYYAAHRHLAEEDLDAVLWLGDYIYEGGAGTGLRAHEGPEVVDVTGYRQRYGTYKSDPNLQAAHAAHPWVVTWDDHEADNNYAGDLADRDVLPPDQFRTRRAAAYQVWWEHQPVRLPPPDGPDYRIYRDATFGDLVTAHVLDTRQYRTNQPCDATSDIGNCAEADSPDATMLGAQQKRWLLDGLRASDARWSVLAQQVMFAPMSFSPDLANPIHNLDQWDGYRFERGQVLKALAQHARNGVVITGDIHSSWVNDLVSEQADDSGTGPKTVATELVGTSITSPFPLAEVLEIAAGAQPHVQYVNGRDHGYVVLDTTRDRMRADFRYVSAVDDPAATIATGVSFEVADRRPGAREV